MFTCTLFDGRLQLFAAQGRDLFTCWKTGAYFDSGWSGWQKFSLKGLSPVPISRKGVGLTLIGKTPLVVLSHDMDGLTASIAMVSKNRLAPTVDGAWEFKGNTWFRRSIHEFIASIAGGALPNGDVQIFFSTINETPGKDVTGQLLSTWTVNELSNLARDEIAWKKADSGLLPLFPIQPPEILHHLTACPLADGRLQLWGTSGSNIWTTWKTTTAANSRWSEWQLYDSFDNQIDAISSARLPDGRVQVWVSAGSDFTCWKQDTSPHSHWTKWEQFGPGRRSSAYASLAVAPLEDGRLQFWRKQGHAIETCWKSGTHADADWTDFGVFPGP